MAEKIQIMPLRRQRVIAKGMQHTYETVSSPTVPSYGDHTYMTADSSFYVRLEEDGWHVHNHVLHLGLAEALLKTGLFATGFPRRRDALEALRAELTSMDIAWS